MGFNFPNSPSTGQIYTPAGGPTFQYNGAAWQSVTQGIPVLVYVSDTAPVSPALGQLWWNSATGNTFIWYQDADSSQWVQISGQVHAKSQSFDQVGKTFQDLVVPAWGPTQARITVFAYYATTTTLVMRFSTDGTTFLSTGYNFGGYFVRAISGGLNNSPMAADNRFYLTDASDNSALPMRADITVTLKPDPNNINTAHIEGSGYHSTWQYTTVVYDGYVDGVTAPLKAIRIYNDAGLACTKGTITVEWM